MRGVMVNPGLRPVKPHGCSQGELRKRPSMTVATGHGSSHSGKGVMGKGWPAWSQSRVKERVLGVLGREGAVQAE